MAEYIEREEIYRRWAEILAEDRREGLAAGILHMALAVVQTPAADVEPVRNGRWVSNGIPDSVLSKCSLCGIMYGSSSFNYCPNCGAKMDLEEKL